MMARLGIELGARTLRGVRLEGWYRTRARTVEIEWDSEHPGEAVAALRQHLGPARRIALALDLPLLFTKQVKLPALEPAGKRSILRLEPERFFAVRAEDIVPAVRGDDSLVFAAKEGPLAEWVAALQQLGPVDLIEPGPVALARALARVGLTTAVTVLDAERDGVGVVEMCDGRVVQARRVFGGLDAVAAALRHNGGTPAALYLPPWSEGRVRALGAPAPDPLRVLLALSQQLPVGAYLRGLRLSGGDGQIDGYAPNASRLVAQLGGLPEFRDVHFLSATNRVAVGDRTYETFTLAFRYAAAP